MHAYQSHKMRPEQWLKCVHRSCQLRVADKRTYLTLDSFIVFFSKQSASSEDLWILTSRVRILSTPLYSTVHSFGCKMFGLSLNLNARIMKNETKNKLLPSAGYLVSHLENVSAEHHSQTCLPCTTVYSVYRAYIWGAIKKLAEKTFLFFITHRISVVLLRYK